MYKNPISYLQKWFGAKPVLLSVLPPPVLRSTRQVTNYYGATREEWRPFGGNQTIDQVLGGIKNQLNGIPRATAIRWASVEEELFADDRKLIEQAAVQLSGPHLWPYGEREWAAPFR